MSQKLRVWHIPQVPGEKFLVEVCSVQEGVKVLDVLANYDQFQFKNNIKPDYCNVNGLSLFDPEDDEDSAEGSWVNWYIDTEDGSFEDPREYLDSLKEKPEEGGIKITTTLGEISDKYDWNKFCKLKGWDTYILNEGKASSDEEVTLSEQQAKDIGIKFTKGE